MQGILNRIWCKLLADPKTTLTGFVGVAAWLVATYGFEVSAEVQFNLVIIFGFILSLFSGDTRQIPPAGSDNPDS